MSSTVRDFVRSFPDPWVLHLKPNELDQPVSGVTSDSRQAGPGTIFVAIHGGSSDGHEFIPQAKAAGAVLMIGERPLRDVRVGPYVQVENARLALAMLAATFHDHPSHSMEVIGVTGTSGKTTTTYLIESILKAAGYKVGVIGTVNFRYGDTIIPSTHTTPGPVELQQILARMRDEGCAAVVMEVSSHALKQDRAAFIGFDGTVFNNLSPEHLDFHPDMEDYFQSKAKLFLDCARYSVQAGKRPVAAINADHPFGARLVSLVRQEWGSAAKLAAFGLSQAGLKVELDGISGEASGVRVRSKLMGRFNAENILGAVAVTRGMGVAPEHIEKGIEDLVVVPGRLERVPNAKGIHVLVDYAHKPDALENVLQTLREIRGKQRLIAVFGCGGDRDRKKRPVMGKLAVTLADRTWITSDNPRTEDPQAIIREILGGVGGHSNFEVEPDRAKAIAAAITEARAGDVVLIAGKGHEDYQIIADPAAPGGTRKIHFDDREVAAAVLR